MFKSYMLIEVVEFKTYVLYMEIGYTAAPDGFNARTLMNNVENAYKRRVKAGTWKPLLEGQVSKEIVGLKNMIEANNAEIAALKATHINDSGSSFLCSQIRMPKVPPGAVTSKFFEDRKYHWCPTHNAWTIRCIYPPSLKVHILKKGAGSCNGNNGNNNQTSRRHGLC
jgi:hypothetical protein